MEITVTYAPTYADYVALARHTARRPLRLLGAAAGVLILALIALPVLSAGRGTCGALFVLVAACCAAAALGLLSVLIALAPTLAAKKRWENAPELREPRRYAFSDDGIAVRGESFGSTAAWAHVKLAERVGGLFVLRTRQDLFHFLSETSFPDGEAKQAFLDLVRSKVPSSF